MRVTQAQHKGLSSDATTALVPATVVDSVTRNATRTFVSYIVEMPLPSLFGQSDKDQLLDICSEYAGQQVELRIDMTFVTRITNELLVGLLEVQDQLGESGGALRIANVQSSLTHDYKSATFAHLFLSKNP